MHATSGHKPSIQHTFGVHAGMEVVEAHRAPAACRWVWGGCARAFRRMLQLHPGLFPFLLAFFFFPCSRADSMSTGRVLNESNPISPTPYQLWTGLFLTADLSHRMPLKNPYPQQLTRAENIMLEEGKARPLPTPLQAEGKERCT